MSQDSSSRSVPPPSFKTRRKGQRKARSHRPLPIHARRAARDLLGITRTVRYSLRWDALAGAFTGAYMGLTSPFFTKIARDLLHAPPEAIAFMVAAPFIGNLFSPFWARQMEGNEKLPWVRYSWITARSLLLLIPLTTGGMGFVGIIAAVQIIGTIASPAYTSLMRDIYPDGTRGRLMGYVRVAMQTLMFVATFAAGRMLDAGFSYRILFPFAGLFGIGAALCFSRVRPLPKHLRPSIAPRRDVADRKTQAKGMFLQEMLAILLQNQGYRYFALSVFVYGAANLMVQPLYSLYQVDVLHISGTQIANLANIASACSIVGAFFWGRFMDRYGPAFTVLCAICLIALIPAVYLTATSVPGLSVAAMLSGFGLAGIELSYMASILLYAEPGRTAQYQSLHSLLLGVRGVLAPLVGVPLAKALGYPFAFRLALSVMVLGAVLQWAALRTGRTGKPKNSASTLV